MRAAFIVLLVSLLPFMALGIDYTVADSVADVFTATMGNHRTDHADGFDFGATCPGSNFQSLPVVSTCGQVTYGGIGCMLASDAVLHPGQVSGSSPICDGTMKYTFPWAGTFNVELLSYSRGSGANDGTANDGNTVVFAVLSSAHAVKQTLLSRHVAPGFSGTVAPVTITAAAGDYVVLRTGQHGDTSHDSFYYHFRATTDCTTACTSSPCDSRHATTCATHDPAVVAFCDDIASKCSALTAECATIRSNGHTAVADDCDASAAVCNDMETECREKAANCPLV